jgi:hypothetical protein
MPFVAKWTMWWMNATTRAWPAKLAWWRGEVEKLYHGQPEHPVMLALKPHVTALDLPQNLLEEIVDGMQMDLDFARYDRFQDLLLYCHRVAGWWASWQRRFSAIRTGRRSNTPTNWALPSS